MTMSKEERTQMWYLLFLKNVHGCCHMIILLTLTNKWFHGHTLLQGMLETVTLILSSHVLMSKLGFPMDEEENRYWGQLSALLPYLILFWRS